MLPHLLWPRLQAVTPPALPEAWCPAVTWRPESHSPRPPVSLPPASRAVGRERPMGCMEQLQGRCGAEMLRGPGSQGQTLAYPASVYPLAKWGCTGWVRGSKPIFARGAPTHPGSAGSSSSRPFCRALSRHPPSRENSRQPRLGLQSCPHCAQAKRVHGGWSHQQEVPGSPRPGAGRLQRQGSRRVPRTLGVQR